MLLVVESARAPSESVYDGGLGGTIPLLRTGLLQAMAAQAAGARDREKQAAHAAAGDELARLRRQLAAEKKD